MTQFSVKLNHVVPNIRNRSLQWNIPPQFSQFDWVQNAIYNDVFQLENITRFK